MTVCGWVNVLLVEGASEEPLGIEEEGGGRVRERLSLTETDEGCGGLNLCETQTSKDLFTAVKMVSLTWVQILVMSFSRGLSVTLLIDSLRERERVCVCMCVCLYRRLVSKLSNFNVLLI